MTNTKALDEAVRRVYRSVANAFAEEGAKNHPDIIYHVLGRYYIIRAEYRRIMAKGERQ